MKGLLAAFEVKTADEMGWAGITNGRLLDAGEAAGFRLMVTADQNIRAQQRLAGRQIAIVVISTNHWDTIKESAAAISSACAGAGGADVYRDPASPRSSRRRTIRTRLIAGLNGDYNSH